MYVYIYIYIYTHTYLWSSYVIRTSRASGSQSITIVYWGGASSQLSTQWGLRPWMIQVLVCQFLVESLGGPQMLGRKCRTQITGWWFGTCFIFPYIGLLIIPNDSYFSEGWPNHQPDHICCQIRSCPIGFLPMFLQANLLIQTLCVSIYPQGRRLRRLSRLRVQSQGYLFRLLGSTTRWCPSSIAKLVCKLVNYG